MVVVVIVVIVAIVFVEFASFVGDAMVGVIIVVGNQ